MKVLVLGGYGAVGGRLVDALRARGLTAVAAGRDPRRADVVVDLGEPRTTAYQRAAARADVVVNATGVEDARLASVATTAGASFVDITATTGYVAELETLQPARPVLLGVGLAPGLTNVLAADLHARAPGPLDLLVVLGAGERHGAAATDWTYRLLGRSFDSAGEPVRNYTRPRTFDLPGYGRRRLYQVDFAEQHTLTRDLGTSVRTYFGLDSRMATVALALLTRFRALAPPTRTVHLPGSDRWLVAAVSAAGPVRFATGRNQSRATADVAAAAVVRAATLPPGVHHLHHHLTPADLPSGLSARTSQGWAPSAR